MAARPGRREPNKGESRMIFMTRKTLPMLAFAIATSLSATGGLALADDAMKPAGQMKSDDGMMKADAMKTDDAAMADCKEKAGMETDQMKKDEAMKACDDVMSDGGMMKPDAMGSDTMKPAQSN